MFWLQFDNIDLFIATHLLRHHVGSVPFQLTCRDDRKGGNQGVPGKCDAIINLVHKLEDILGQEAQERLDVINEIVGIAEDLKENSDRHTPVILGLLVNAQAIMDISKLRLCNQAHADTIKVWKMAKEAIREVDPALAAMMVRKCVYRGGLCGERCCGFNNTNAFTEELSEYTKNFSTQQKGRYIP